MKRPLTVWVLYRERDDLRDGLAGAIEPLLARPNA
jgi:hypothetical protein